MFPRSRKFGECDSYNSGMVTFRAPSGASEQLAHAIELVNRDLDGLIDHLDLKRQNEFWTELHQFALAETQGKGRNAHLIVAEHINPKVREALELFDEKVATHLAGASRADREQFWRMLHDVSEEQARESKQPKAKHGGGAYAGRAWDHCFKSSARERTLQVFGIRLVGISAENGRKLLFTVLFILLVVLLNWALKLLVKGLVGKKLERVQFWTRQGIRLFTTALLLIGLISIWFNNPSQLASAAAFVTAGLAIASQRMITAFAGYFIILRGKNFNVGDRIVMGGVRGDVIRLGFMQTAIMEMGQPPGEQADAPSLWVSARQYTGRIVTVTNDKIFDTPVYNYTSEFPYIWEEMRIPIPYNANRRRAERFCSMRRSGTHQRLQDLGEEPLQELERRYMIKRAELEPRVYYRLTDNWCEMAVRFIVGTHDVRGVKDKMSRDIIDGLDAAGMGIASGTYEVVGMPELKVRIRARRVDAETAASPRYG